MRRGAEQARGFIQQRIAAARIHDIVGNGGHSEITHDADDHKDEVGNVRGTEERVAVLLHLLDIQLQHHLLYLTDNTPENVRHRQRLGRDRQFRQSRHDD